MEEFARTLEKELDYSLEAAGLDRCKLARQGFELIMKQVFVDGFFHADPHPGNIFVLPNNVICYVDFGMMGRINRQGQENCADLVMSVVCRNEAETVDALVKLTICRGTGTLPLALGQGIGAEIRNGVGIASAGGILASGVLTLIVMPIRYDLFTRKERPPHSSS